MCQSETYFEQFPAHPTDQKPQRDIVTYMPSSFSSTVYICLPHMSYTTLSFQILIHSDQHEVIYACINTYNQIVIIYIYLYISYHNLSLHYSYKKPQPYFSFRISCAVSHRHLHSPPTPFNTHHAPSKFEKFFTSPRCHSNLQP